MVQINFAKREVQCKVVYYGPARSGKTTNLRTIHARSPEGVRGALTSIQTDEDRTLFFDFLPLNLGSVADIDTKVHLYAVPYLTGQNANRALVLEGIDGIVFVADSSPDRLTDNLEALGNLRANLAHMGRNLDDIPLVFQWNKSDLDGALPTAELQAALGAGGSEAYPACALDGTGVFEALKAVTRLVLVSVSGVLSSWDEGAEQPESPAPAEEQPLEPVPAGYDFSVEDYGGERGPWEESDDLSDVSMVETSDFERLPQMPDEAPLPMPPLPEELVPALPPEGPTPLQSPEAVREAARVLAQPTGESPLPEEYQVPLWTPPPYPPVEPALAESEPEQIEPTPPPLEPRTPRMTPAAPQRLAGLGWDQIDLDGGAGGRRQSPIARERRRRPRIADRKNVASAGELAAGAVGTLLSLAVVGYLVVVLL